jgi:hypothetical protein
VTRGTLREQASDAPVIPGEQPLSIVVLPFANLGSDSEGDHRGEYFGDGLAEEITNALVQISGLRVIARTSAFAFKGRNEDIRKIAETLGVSHMLEGSVRRSGACYQRAAALDPDYARPHTGMAEFYIWMSIEAGTPPRTALPRAAAAARRALELDETYAVSASPADYDVDGAASPNEVCCC